MNIEKVTVQEIKEILHSVRDSRYLFEKSSDVLQDVANAVNMEQLLLIEENIPNISKHKIDEILALQGNDFQHSKFCCAEIWCVLEAENHSRLKKGFKIIPTPFYNGGKADIGLIHNLDSDYETIIAVEVGDVRFDKPIDAFYSNSFSNQMSLSELWIYPTPGTDYSLGRMNKKKNKKYYIFRRGRKFKELKKELDIYNNRIQRLAADADPLMQSLNALKKD